MSSQDQNKKDFQQASGNKRWYDVSPVLKQSVITFTRFPIGIQSIIAIEMNEMAEQRYDIKYKLKSLGKDKILAMHKAQSKQRSYDTCPHVSKTFNYWFILPDQERLNFASQIMGTSSAVYRFLKVAQEHKYTFEEQDLKRVVSSWIWEGEASTSKLIDEYQDRLRTRAIEIEVEEKLRIQDDNKGMILDHNIVQFKRKI